MSEWTWEYEGYDPDQEQLREALTTLGNGYFATRGAAPETAASSVHYPGTYAAGVYNRLVSTVAGREVENEDMVNLPNWLPLRFRILDTGTGTGTDAHAGGGAGDWLTPDDTALDSHRLVLDLRAGTLTRTSVLVDPAGRRLRLEQQRLVHMGDPHLAALRTTLTPEGWSGGLEIASGIDGSVTNDGVARYRRLDGRHLTHVHTGTAPSAEAPDTVWLRCRTTTSDVRIAMAARTRLAGGEQVPARFVKGELEAARVLTVPADDGRSVTVEKTVALHTSHDPAISDPLQAACDRVARAPDFDALLASHGAAWETLWEATEFDVPGKAGRILRLHLFHVLQTLSPHTVELDVGVPARGLHGEAYRGHVFWDELFVLPFLNFHLPDISRALLDYRHRRLPQACRSAAAIGRLGALYPWQSGSDGREETQQMHLNPRSGRWLPDHSRLQYHVGSAIAYNVWQYCRATADTAYLHTKGAEMVLQVARFWADLAAYDEESGRYHIRGVVGPDEYHEAYPEREEPGLDDNAYTNVTAAWVLRRALDLTDGLLPAACRQELLERLGVRPEELERWESVSRRLAVPFHQGVISQFDGYGELAELDWEGLRERHGDIRRLDRVLEADGDSVNRYQASKQADVLMLGYLFGPEELAGIFGQLGYELDDALWRRTVDYYLARTSHGSTLSGLVHGWVLARARRADAWKYFLEALTGDVADIQGGTTGEGIHLGAMAGTLDLVQRCLTGLEARDDALVLDLVPLPQLSEYGFSLRYRGHWGVALRRRGKDLGLSVPDSPAPPLRVLLGGRSVSVESGESCWVRLPDG